MSFLLLIHGGATTGRHWDRVVEHLAHPSLAVHLPGRLDRPADLTTVTLDDAVASVAGDARAAGLDDVVVVAHSSGGLVVPGVVTALRDLVRHVVFVSASIPPEGGCGLDCMKASHRTRILEGKEACARAGVPFVTPADPPDREQLRGAYGGRPLTDDELDFALDPVRWVCDTYNFYFPAVSWADVVPLPRTYVRDLRDRAVPVALQDEMLARLPAAGTTVVTLDAGHVPAITMPVVLAGLLDGIAAASSTVT